MAGGIKRFVRGGGEKREVYGGEDEKFRGGEKCQIAAQMWLYHSQTYRGTECFALIWIKWAGCCREFSWQCLER